jgi:hypothetical protein
MESRRSCFGRVILMALAAAALALGLAGCGPEAARVQGGGPGADVGNHGSPVALLGGQTPAARIYFDTPRDRLP